MTIRISETIHKWMGWCPAKQGLATPGEIQEYGIKTGHTPSSPDRVAEDRIIDYVPAGSSVLHLLSFGAGIAVIVSFIKLITLFFIAADTIIFFCILLTSAFILTYNDLKKTKLESFHGNLIIHRPIFKPVIIPKEEIVNEELLDNRRPVPYWLVAIFTLILIPVYSITGIYDRYCSWISGDSNIPIFIIYLGFFITINVFFLSIYRYYRIRYRYPKSFVITTKKNKKLVIYGKSSEELAEIKERLI